MSFVDSAGLDALAVTRDRLQGSGQSFVLRSPTLTLERWLERCGMADMVEHPGERRECRPAC